MSSHRCAHRIPRLLRLAALVWVACLVGAATVARAQTCWVYTDGEPAPVPIDCVQKFDTTLPCDWNDGLSDCTAIPSASPQNIRRMHEIWHGCFGPVGGPNPPAGRSARWYAFHRQFELDFNRWRRGIGIAPIESVDWCPNMPLAVGTGPEVVGHPAGCGTGTPRPDGALCPQCVPFPHCLFRAGGGPIACPAAPSASCETPDGTVSFPYASLEEFQNVDEVAKILDGQFHGIMHGAIGLADRTPADGCDPGAGITGGCYNLDSLGSDCSPRDPMFWRLHHALDDVVRAWQDAKAVDVMLVVDRSGSMSEPDAAGGGSKLTAALAAVDSFADLLESNRPDGQVNRVGVVSYSDSASLDMPLSAADANLRAGGGPLDNAITGIVAAGPNGCTGIGAALQRAVEELCPPGDCRGFSAGGDNDRKAILLLTDGVENVAPCLLSAGPAGASCGSQCFGSSFDLAKLEFTQLVAVGFGDGASLNGPLLTTVAERQGGIYLQNPNAAGPGNDLKDFYAKAFGQLSSEFLLLDPHGTLPAAQAATDPVVYNGCTDATLTFTSGWNAKVAAGDLALLVTTPSGDLVRGSDPGVEASRQPLWDFSRVNLPYRGARDGQWQAQLVRPHAVYVNGFTPDAFAAPADGARLARREIQRLCPNGCKRVLFYENGRRGPRSAYRDALDAEVSAGLLGGVTVAADETRFARALAPGRWDLIVYAEMGADRRARYDALLARLLCAGQRAILTDVRRRSAAAIFKCAGAAVRDPFNWDVIDGSGQLVTRAIKLVNPGHPVFTYGVTGPDIQALSNRQVGAVVARVAKGKDEDWYVDVLGSTLGKLSPHLRQIDWKTGAPPIAAVRMLPSYIRAGGWDKVEARVEVEYPTESVGTLLARRGLGEGRKVRGEWLDPRAVALAGLNIPTAKATFPLFDDGTHGDIYPANGYWSGELTGLGRTDGPYRLRFLFDLTANGCTTHRELAQTMIVDVGVAPKATKVAVAPGQPRADGWSTLTATAWPRDTFGNLLGPGRAGQPSCQPAGACKLLGEPKDAGDGSYVWSLATAPGTASVRLQAWGVPLDVAVPCSNCARVASLKITPEKVVNQQPATAVVELTAPAPKTAQGGAVVFLTGDKNRVARLPESVVVPAGKTRVEIPVTVYHVHDEPEMVELTATYGGASATADLTVSPPAELPKKPHTPAVLPKGYYRDHKHHDHGDDE